MPKIFDADRSRFESEMKITQKDKEFSIKELSTPDNIIKSQQHPYYFPVKYIEPENENLNALGFNIYSNITRRKTIIESIKSRKLTVTPRIKLVQDSSGYGLLGIVPVFYSNNFNPEKVSGTNVKGLISIVFKVDNLIDKVILESKRTHINLIVYDITTVKELLYYPKGLLLNKQKIIKKKINVGGRVWELNFIIDPIFYKVPNSYFILFVGLTITAIIVLLLLAFIFRAKLLKNSERKYFEESLKDSEERLRMTMEVTQTAIWDWDLIHDKWYASPLYYSMLGYKPEVGFGNRMVWLERIHPDDRESVEQKIRSVQYENATSFMYEARLKHADGSYRWQRVLGSIIENDAKRNVKRMLGTRTDITDQKIAELKLIESEEQYRALFQESSSAMLLLNPSDGRIVDANNSACSFYGYSLDEIKHLNISDINTLSLEEIKGELINATENDRLKLNFNHRLANGSIKSVEVYSGKVLLSGKEMLYAIIHDITERKSLEKEVELSVREMEMINKTITVCNQQHDLKQLFDIILEQLLGVLNLESATLCLMEEDSTLKLASFINVSEKVINELTNKKIKIGDCLCGDCALQCKSLILNNSSEVLEYSNSYTHDNEDIRYHAAFPIVLNNKCLGVVCAYTKTDFKPNKRALDLIELIISQVAVVIENLKLYEKLSLYNQELEIGIKKRTIQLEAINKELEAFSYSVSHDLRAPLRHINGYIDLINRRIPDSFDEKGKHYLKNISESATQMSMLIDDLLHFSRTGRQEMKFSKVNMNLLVNDVVSTLKYDNKERNIEWVISDLPEVHGDYNLLKQVWINLLSNAVKFTRKKEKAIIVINSQQEINEFVFSVSDNGVGFDMKYSSKLFGVFQRLHSTADFEGTGIGLANVNRIILRHGGRIWADAEVDNGATFYFTLVNNKM